MSVAREIIAESDARNTTETFSLLDAVEAQRISTRAVLDTDRQAELGQYFTPAPIARFMASLFPARPSPAHLRLLDAGAGIGVLTAAWVQAVCAWPQPPLALSVTAYEVDDALIPQLRRVCEKSGRVSPGDEQAQGESGTRA